MSRLLALSLGLMIVGPAAAQCLTRPAPRPVVCVPVYPLTSAVWGGPAPAYVPPPAPRPAVRESEEPPAPPSPTPAPKKDVPAAPEKPKDPKESKDEPPKIPKQKLLLPGEPPAKLSAEPLATGDAPKAFDQFLVPADAPRAEPAAQVKVGFFNHSARDLVLTVHGEDVTLPGGQFVTLRLPRTFEWAEKGKKAAAVTVPNDADGVEIVFRK